MKTTTIPEATRKAALAIAKKNERELTVPMSCPVPEMAIEAVTADRGTYKPGLRCWIIGGEGRTVFLGADVNPIETELAEFVLILESGARWSGQYKRDFVFAQDN